MNTIHIYLNFDGNCEEAFTFYKEVFASEFSYFSRFGEMPPSEDYVVPDSDLNKIMHVALPLGNTLLMGSDIGLERSPLFNQGNNFSISITAESKDEADQLFLKLQQGGSILMPLEMTFWGDYFGMIADKFGINWMVSFNESNE
jgi:PhnB protein